MYRFIYSCCFFLALPLIVARLFWRGLKQPGYIQHIGERFGFYEAVNSSGVIWIHAVSVGEVRAAAPLVHGLKEKYPSRDILISCMTPTGRETCAELLGEVVRCVYLPYDLVVLQKRLINQFRPAMLLIMETEIWPNLFVACHAERVPVFIVNGRLSERSLQRYQSFGPVREIVRDALGNLRATGAQSSADARRFEALGANNVVVTGNLKFEQKLDDKLVAMGREWKRQVAGSRRVLLAASTREGEEVLLLEAYRKQFGETDRDGVLLLIVPRHPQRFDAVFELARSMDFTIGRRSANLTESGKPDIWLGDSMGEMAAYIAMCDVAFVGGSLLPLGGQNLIEVCLQAKPVVMGSSTFNFSEAVELAIREGAMLSAVDADDALLICKRILSDGPLRTSMSLAARSFAEKYAGAVAQTLSLL